jgi:hypothetical protein
MPSMPGREYIQKLILEPTIRPRSIVHQQDENNLQSIIKKRVTCEKGKRVILKGHFYISTQGVCDAVIEAEKSTKKQAGRKREKRVKDIVYQAGTDEDVEGDTEDDSESEIRIVL